MSYIYLQGQGAESSAGRFSDIPAYVLSRLNLTASKSCFKGRETESFRSFQSGTTLKPLTDLLGAGGLTLCAEDSPAKTLARQEKAQELKVIDLGYGKKCGESFARYDPEESLWKTRQCSLFGGLEEFSETWPRWGIMENGVCWDVTIPEEPITERGYGYLPTLRRSGQSRAFKVYVRKKYKGNLEEFLGKIGFSGFINPQFSEAMMMWPIGWTDISPLAMDKFQSWQQQHSKF